MKTVIKTSFWTILKEYAMITIGLLAYVLGWSVFLIPNNLVGGGVSGISAIIYYATGIKMGYTYLVINVVLLLVSIKVIGFGFGWKTIYAIVFASLMLNILPPLIPDYITQELAVSNGKLLCTIIGGVMSGFGIGMSISQGGSTGGTDIIALIVGKYRNISPGRLILAMDVVIILSSMLFPSYTADGSLVPFPEKLATAVYGLILITVSGYSVDMYLSGTKQSVQAFIFSKKYEEIADAVAYGMKRGVTLIPAEGWYTKNTSHVLMVVTRRADLNTLLKYIKTIDPNAFISVSSVMGVYGQGFDTIKVKKVKKDSLGDGRASVPAGKDVDKRMKEM